MESLTLSDTAASMISHSDGLPRAIGPTAKLFRDCKQKFEFGMLRADGSRVQGHV